jgi:hypothetical protein
MRSGSKLIFIFTAALVAINSAIFLSPVNVKIAQAIDVCPAGQTYSHLTVRQGGPTGPILAQYQTSDPPGQFRTENITINQGTVLYIHASS